MAWRTKFKVDGCSWPTTQIAVKPQQYMLCDIGCRSVPGEAQNFLESGIV